MAIPYYISNGLFLFNYFLKVFEVLYIFLKK